MERIVLAIAVAASLVLTVASPVDAADCARTGTGLVPLPQLGTGTYRGEQGGLYPGGVNEPPAAYAAAGGRAAERIVPRAADGAPAADGRVVLLSIGMSNTTQEFSAFVQAAARDATRDASVVLVDGAQGGEDARKWAVAGSSTWTTVDARLARANVTAAQVQAVWLKQAHARPAGDMATTVAALEQDLAAIVAHAAARFPNLAQVFVSPRTYGGYAATPLNPEPYAYESGFAVKRLVARSVAAPDARPWVGWGPYLWADGVTASASGLSWSCSDFSADGTHPSDAGRRKVASALERHFATSPFTAWYRSSEARVATDRAMVAAGGGAVAPAGDGTWWAAATVLAASLAVLAAAAARHGRVRDHAGRLRREDSNLQPRD